MSQSRTRSVLESVVNVLVGYAIAVFSQVVIFRHYGLRLPLSLNLITGLWFTLVSIVRSFTLRRLFNIWD